jgi:hypothetical protein
VGRAYGYKSNPHLIHDARNASALVFQLRSCKGFALKGIPKTTPYCGKNVWLDFETTPNTHIPHNVSAMFFQPRVRKGVALKGISQTNPYRGKSVWLEINPAPHPRLTECECFGFPSPELQRFKVKRYSQNKSVLWEERMVINQIRTSSTICGM